MSSVLSSTSAANRSVADLYSGQTAGQNIFKSYWFPRYSSQHIKSQEGFKGMVIQCYSHVYNGINFLDSSIKDAASIAAKIGNFALGWAIQPLGDFGYYIIGCHIERVCNAVYPINPINGERHFVIIPRSLEKMLGDYLFYPLASYEKKETSELLSGTRESMAHRVASVLQRLSQSNEELLNPSTETTKFDYRVKTVSSSDINAFAVPAGGMVVFSQMVKELHGAVVSQEIKETCVEFADGSHVNVDLSSVTLDDVLAALMGHEMTHAASRHSIMSICVGLIHSLLLNVGRICLIHFLQSTDKNYQRLKQKSQAELSLGELTELQSRQELYDKLNQVFEWVQGRIDFLDTMFRTRTNEYEADVTGAYFAHKARFNPLGAIYLQEFLSKKSQFGFLHKHLEFLFSHPYGENRKRALFASIAEFAPQSLQGRLSQWHLADNTAYDTNSLSPAFKYCSEIATTFRQ